MKTSTTNTLVLNLHVTSGSTCCTVGGFTDYVVSIPVQEILSTPTKKAIALFNKYAYTLGDIKVHFEDTLEFCDSEYQKDCNDTNVLTSAIAFGKIIHKCYSNSKCVMFVKSFDINTPTLKTKGTTMNNTITFEKAVYDRLGTCKTWNPTRLRTVVKDMWVKDHDLIKSESTGGFLAKFFDNFKADLKARKFNFFDTHLVVDIYNRTWNEMTVTPAEVVEEKPMHEVLIYTDGSCNQISKVGGWGVHIGLKGHPKYDKELSGSGEDETNNTMELRALIEALTAIDINKPGFKFLIMTDSKYVLQSLVNLNRYISQGFKKAANPELLTELYTLLRAKGIKMPKGEESQVNTKDLKSGDTFFTASNGLISFVWVKGHNGDVGNERADKIAVAARKQLEKELKSLDDVVVPEVVSEAPEKGPELPSVDSVVVVTQENLDSVAEYNLLNKKFDYTFQFSDSARSYQLGMATEKELKALAETLSPLELDLTALYHNHILGRSGDQFGKVTTILEDSIHTAKQYF